MSETILSEKATKILFLLLNNAGQSMSARRVAAMVGVSERCAGTLIREVCDFCAQVGQVFVSNKPGRGVSLTVNAGSREELILRLKASLRPGSSAEYRGKYIKRLLLTNWTTYSIAAIADDLDVSRSTIERDLSEVQDWFAKFQTEIVRRAGKGLSLKGSELNIRNALVAETREHSAAPCEGAASLQGRLTGETYRRLREFYREEDIGRYRSLICEIERAIERKLADRSFETMLEYLLAAHLRAASGNTLSPRMEGHRAAFEALSEALEPFMKERRFLPVEKDYVLLLLAAMEFQGKEPLPEPRDSVLEALTRETVSYLEDVAGIRTDQQEELLRVIYSYNKAAAVRIVHGIRLLNPYVTEAKTREPALFSACFALRTVYRKHLGFSPSEEELCELCMLLSGLRQPEQSPISAILCCAFSAGRLWALSSRLMREVPGLCVEAMTPQEYSAQKKADLLIVSGRAVQSARPTVEISPLLTPKDLDQLNRAIAGLREKAAGAGRAVTVGEHIRDSLIFLDVEAQSKNEVLKRMVDALRREGCVEGEYYENILRREQVSCTSIGKGVAIPHSFMGAVKRPAVCMMRLAQPVDWGEDLADLIFMLALDFQDVAEAKIFFKTFCSLTTKEEILRRLRGAKTPTQIRQAIGESSV